ncbi:hypothetical protein JOE49_004888 [Paenibacillus sp. PvR133]|uniref:hypothetical protein n=1 Tax=Paenibacillus sp. PvR133 TaxID=2806598 RepID=UPI001AEB048C|nr:hypothetical protein [Paenibacillus sp. PvR133]MBP1177636.1 hypothetical protein [Paenibacillus sp. PvR133]
METFLNTSESTASKQEVGTEEKNGNDPTEQTTNLELKKDNLKPVHFALIAEELVFKDIEKQYQKQVQRHIRIIGRSSTVIELDGLLELDTRDIIFDTKVFLQSPLPLTLIKKSINKKISQVIDYQSITKKNKEVQLTYVIVSSFEKETKEKLDDRLSKLSNDMSLLNVKINFLYYSFHELDLENVVV